MNTNHVLFQNYVPISDDDPTALNITTILIFIQVWKKNNKIGEAKKKNVEKSEKQNKTKEIFIQCWCLFD